MWGAAGLETRWIVPGFALMDTSGQGESACLEWRLHSHPWAAKAAEKTNPNSKTIPRASSRPVIINLRRAVLASSSVLLAARADKRKEFCPFDLLCCNVGLPATPGITAPRRSASSGEFAGGQRL